MKLLLDTHIWVWSVLEPARLTARVATALGDPDNELWVSPMSTFELMALVAKRRLRLDPEPEDWVRSSLARAPFRAAPVTHEVALRVRHLGLRHGDPVDALLAATAAVYDLTLVTADRRLIRSGSCAVLPNHQ